jgi:hypothetical protein
MEELFPLVAGVVVGLIASRIASTRVRLIVATVLTLVFATTATLISGEAAESWAFIIVDIGEVAIVAAIAWGIATFVARRVAQSR